MPNVLPPFLNLSGLPAELQGPLGNFFREQDAFNRGVALAVNKSLVFGDTLRVLAPFTAAAPLVVPSDWQTPTLTGGFSNVGGGNEAIQYRKDARGLVTLRGLGKTALALSQTAFTLPSGYLPALNHTVATVGNAGASDVFSSIAITSAGAVLVQSGAASNYISFALSFYCSDFSPYVPSCYPFDVAWMAPAAPTLVVAQCVDATSPASPINIALNLADWTTVTLGGRSFLRIRNLPGLPSGRSYAVTLIAF